MTLVIPVLSARRIRTASDRDTVSLCWASVNIIGRAVLVVDSSHVQLPCSTHWESGSERMDTRRLLCHSLYRAGIGNAELNGLGHAMGRGSGLRCVTGWTLFSRPWMKR